MNKLWEGPAKRDFDYSVYGDLDRSILVDEQYDAGVIHLEGYLDIDADAAESVDGQRVLTFTLPATPGSWVYSLVLKAGESAAVVYRGTARAVK